MYSFRRDMTVTRLVIFLGSRCRVHAVVADQILVTELVDVDLTRRHAHARPRSTIITHRVGVSGAGATQG